MRQRFADKALIPRLGGPRRLVDVEGMTRQDWERVYWAYLAFATQVRCLVADVESRQRDGQDAIRLHAD